MVVALALVFAVGTGARPPANAAGAPEPPAPEPAVAAFFDHDLATLNSIVRVTWPSITLDRVHRELYVVAEGFVRIFDANGMEIHRFGDDGSLGQVARVAVLEDGQIVVMTRRDGKLGYVRCDFKGEPLEEIVLSGLPEGFAGFEPDQLVYHDGRLYFAERTSMRVIVTDVMGEYRQSFMLRDLVAGAAFSEGERRGAAAMDAFNVDTSGNLLFTMSTLFAVGVVNTRGELRVFGARGSRPGRFNNVGGVAADENGYIYVTDRLRSVVSVWDRELQFLGDFGYRGDHPTNLVAPYELAAGEGKVYVAQAGEGGVRVFRVIVREQEPVAPETPPEQPAPRAPRDARGRDAVRS